MRNFCPICGMVDGWHPTTCLGKSKNRPQVKEGDRIKIPRYIAGKLVGEDEFVVEEFRFCLGVFLSNEARQAGDFTPLCNLYVPGPNADQKYIPNYGSFYTEMVPGWKKV